MVIGKAYGEFGFGAFEGGEHELDVAGAQVWVGHLEGLSGMIGEY